MIYDVPISSYIISPVEYRVHCTLPGIKLGSRKFPGIRTVFLSMATPKKQRMRMKCVIQKAKKTVQVVASSGVLLYVHSKSQYSWRSLDTNVPHPLHPMKQSVKSHARIPLLRHLKQCIASWSPQFSLWGIANLPLQTWNPWTHREGHEFVKQMTPETLQSLSDRPFALQELWKRFIWCFQIKLSSLAV